MFVGGLGASSSDALVRVAHLRFYTLDVGANRQTVDTYDGSTWRVLAPLDSRYPMVHASAVVLGGSLAVFAGGSNFDRNVRCLRSSRAGLCLRRCLNRCVAGRADEHRDLRLGSADTRADADAFACSYSGGFFVSSCSNSLLYF